MAALHQTLTQQGSRNSGRHHSPGRNLQERSPVRGSHLAGVFTEGASAQLRSLGFSVLHFSYESVVGAFKDYGIDAAFKEDTPDAVFQKKVKRYDRLSPAEKVSLARALLHKQKADVREFMAALEKVVSRQIERITILPLYGSPTELTNVEQAIRFMEAYSEKPASVPIQRYEIRIRYNNADSIEATFADRGDAVAFLRTYLPVPIDDIREQL